MSRIHTHHGESLAGSCLAVCKNSTIVSLKTVDGTFFTNFLEHIFLRVVIADGVESEFFSLIAIEGLNGVSVFFDVNTDPVVLLFLP